MLGAGDLILAGGWRLLPRSLREDLTQKLVAVQARARQQVPRSSVEIYPFTDASAAWAAKRGRTPAAPIKIEAVPNLKYSLLTTCRNEQSAITEWLDSVLRQTAYPDEIIIVDGGSNDGTLMVLERWEERHAPEARFKLRVISESNLNIAQGRNRAAAEAQNSLLLFSDVGTVLDRHWAERMLYPFEERPETEVVMGWYRPITSTSFQEAVANYLLPGFEALDLEAFLPSSRSLAISKQAFENSPGYPEFLNLAGEDSLFDFYLKSSARNFAFVPDAIVFWRAPKTVPAAFKTIAAYAQGDAEGGELFGGYYVNLVPRVLKAAAEFLLVILLLLAGAASANFFFRLIFWAATLNFLCRIFSIVSSYRPGAGGTGKIFPRAGAALVLACAQTVGFLRGLRNRPAVESKRISSALQGHLVLMLPEVAASGAENESAKLVCEQLRNGWYVTVVCERGLASQDPFVSVFAHPRLEQHLRKAFAVDLWWAKHQKFAQQSGKQFSCLDYSRDAFSKELISRLEPLGSVPR